MDPRKWRTTRARKTLAEVADALDKTTAAVSGYERGTITPNLDVIIKYEEISGGLVRAKDWVEMHRKDAA